MRFLYGVWILLALSLLVPGCARKNAREVTVYTTVDQVFSEPVLRDFERQTGIHVKALFDTEEAKSTGVLNRLLAEKNNPQCDVFWSGDPLRAHILKVKGISQPYASPIAADINKYFKDKDQHWTGFSARARVLIYNKNRLGPEDVPHSIFELADPKYKNRVVVANPLFGTTSFHFAALFSVLGREKAEQFLTDLQRNGVLIVPSNSDVRKRVASGEYFCGITDTDDAFEAQKQDRATGMVFLDQKDGEMGTLIIPNTVSLIKHSPHPGTGKRLADYLLSAETEAKLAVSCAQMPLHRGVPTPPDVPSLDTIKPMAVDYDDAAEMLEQILPYLRQWTENR